MKKYGALEHFEAVGEDLDPKMTGGMKFVNFAQMAKAKEDEVVLFSYIVFKSKAHRDRVKKSLMKDFSMQDPKWKDMPMPFDMKKMAYGGFKSIVDL